MPRRYYVHLPQYHTLHVVATVGSWFLVAGLLMFVGTMPGRHSGEGRPRPTPGAA